MDVARLAFDERRDMSILRASQEIALPMTRDGAVLDARRTVRNRHGVNNLPTELARLVSPACSVVSADGCADARSVHAFVTPRACTRRDSDKSSRATPASSHHPDMCSRAEPAICSGDQLARSFAATTTRSGAVVAKRLSLGRFA